MRSERQVEMALFYIRSVERYVGNSRDLLERASEKAPMIPDLEEAMVHLNKVEELLSKAKHTIETEFKT